MSIDLQKRIRDLKVLSIVSTICQLSLVWIIVLSVSLAVWKKNVVTGIVAASTVVIPIGVLSMIQRDTENRKECRVPWRVSVNVTSIEHAVQTLNATRITEHAWVSFQEFHGVRLRIMMQSIEKFDKKRIQNERKKANSMINRIWQIPFEQPLSEISSQIRVYCIFCESEMPDLEGWIQHDAVHLLYRNECILNLAMISSADQMLIPSFCEILDYSQVKRLQAAIQLFCERFSFHSS